jgi:hypothetical protein
MSEVSRFSNPNCAPIYQVRYSNRGTSLIASAFILRELTPHESWSGEVDRRQATTQLETECIQSHIAGQSFAVAPINLAMGEG